MDGFVKFILIFAVIGNLVLLSGGYDDFPTLCILTIIADVVFVGLIILSIINSAGKKPDNIAESKKDNDNELKREEGFKKQSSGSSSINDNDTVSRKKAKHDKQMSSKSFSSNAIHTIDSNEIISQIRSKYIVKPVAQAHIVKDPFQKEMESYQCVEIEMLLRRLVNRRRELVDRLSTIKSEMDLILSCHGCSTEQECVHFLRSKEQELEQLINEYQHIYNSINQFGINLLSREMSKFRMMVEAFRMMSKSEKKVCENGLDYSDLIKTYSTLPKGLFQSSALPINLDFEEYHFYILPDVILVYNKDKYIMALEPNALKVLIVDKQRNVTNYRHNYDEWSFKDDIIGADSKLISEGRVGSYWLHERKNGGPDLRYSYNPRTEYRTDTYSYTEIRIQIGEYKAVCSLSQGDLSSALFEMILPYRNITHKYNYNRSLMRLLENTAKHKDRVLALTNDYEMINDDKICEEIVL